MSTQPSSPTEPPPHKPGGFIVAAYALSIAAMSATAGLSMATLGPLWAAAAGYLAATLVIYGFSLYTRNTSMYDIFWSVLPPALGVWAWLVLGPPADLARGVLALGIMSWWGVRLTYNWWRGWPGMHHEDWRYVDLRKSSGRAYGFVNLMGLHVFPSVQTFLGTVPVMFAVSSAGHDIGLLDLIATLLGVTAVTLEMVADRQLHEFVAGPREPGQVLERGLWAYSRHPNYFGEMLFWWSMWLFALSAGAPTWTIAGAAAITVMLFTVSLPMIEKRMVARRPSYTDVQRRVSMIIPWFRRES